jgi:hypothetical protein
MGTGWAREGFRLFLGKVTDLFWLSLMLVVMVMCVVVAKRLLAPRSSSAIARR